MKSIYYLLFISLFLLKTTAFSQNQNSVKELINKTEMSIYKAQKEMISGHSPKKTQEFTLAIKYQVLAVEFYKNNDLKSAVCNSLKAREYSNTILSAMKLTGLDYFLPNTSEVELSKQVNYNNSNETFGSAISSSMIEESVLYDNQKLRSTFNLSSN